MPEPTNALQRALIEVLSATSCLVAGTLEEIPGRADRARIAEKFADGKRAVEHLRSARDLIRAAQREQLDELSDTNAFLRRFSGQLDDLLADH